MMTRNEFRIFLSFFFIYLFFIHWQGWNENSRFDLIRAIDDEARFEIDSFYNNTGDRTFYNNHYYSDKEPGLSLLGLPIYSFWKITFNKILPVQFTEKYNAINDFVSSKANDVTIYYHKNPGIFVLLSMLFLVAFTSSLFSALTIVLIYKITRYFKLKESHRFSVVIIAGLGTLILPYAISFLDHAAVTFFSFLSFYILFVSKKEKSHDNKLYLLSGLILGISFVINTITAVFFIGYIFYLFAFYRRGLAYFILGFLIGVLPLAIYNYSIFNQFFTLPRFHLDKAVWRDLPGNNGINLPNPFVFIRLLIYPEKGLLFYYPMFIIPLIFLPKLYRMYKYETILAMFFLFSFLIINSSWWAWWGGPPFGPRHLTPVAPFFVILVISVFFSFESLRVPEKTLITLLIIISIFTNIIGLQSPQDNLTGKDLIHIKKDYANKVNSFVILTNQLEPYILLTKEYGPRSLIFENLYDGHIDIDIRDVPLARNWKNYNSDKSIPFLSLVIILSIVSLMWLKEIKATLIKKFKLY